MSMTDDGESYYSSKFQVGREPMVAGAGSYRRNHPGLKLGRYQSIAVTVESMKAAFMPLRVNIPAVTQNRIPTQ